MEHLEYYGVALNLPSRTFRLDVCIYYTLFIIIVIINLTSEEDYTHSVTLSMDLLALSILLDQWVSHSGKASLYEISDI